MVLGSLSVWSSDSSQIYAALNEALYYWSEKHTQIEYDRGVIEGLRISICSGGVQFSDILSKRRLSTNLDTLIAAVQEVGNNDGKIGLLHLAVMQNNANSARFVSGLICAGANPELETTNGDTALTIAAEVGNVDAARVMIAYGADPNKENKSHMAPIHIAVLNGQINFLKSLLKDIHNKNIPDQYGRLNLKRIDINKKTSDEYQATPLHLAVKDNEVSVVRYLLSCGAKDVDNQDVGSPLLVAAVMAHKEIVELLVAAGFNVEGIKDDANRKKYLAKFCALEKIEMQGDIEDIIDNAFKLEQQDMDYFKLTEYISSPQENPKYLVARLLSAKMGIRVLDLNEVDEIVAAVKSSPECANSLFAMKYSHDHSGKMKLFNQSLLEKNCVLDPTDEISIITSYPGYAGDDFVEVSGVTQGE